MPPSHWNDYRVDLVFYGNYRHGQGARLQLLHDRCGLWTSTTLSLQGNWYKMTRNLLIWSYTKWPDILYPAKTGNSGGAYGSCSWGRFKVVLEAHSHCLSSSSDVSECFICRDAELVASDPLRNFCDCKNMVAHHLCLATWIKRVRRITSVLTKPKTGFALHAQVSGWTIVP